MKLDLMTAYQILRSKSQDMSIVRRDRNRNGGGVAMYIRSCITFTNRNDLVPESLEQICVEINKPTVRASRS